jgi:type I restriction enzyme S subunit
VKLPAYPRTKPSGVEWLGDVPEHWEVKRSDAIVSADRSQLSPEAFADREVFHYSIPVVQETGTGQIENGESIASAKQVVKKPVVLVSKLNPRKATICLAKPQAILTLCSTEFVALNADKCELSFLEYLTRSELFRQGLDSKVQSVTRSHQRANPADIYKFWNAWPTLEDQRSIAAYLDRETGRVDRLVAKKRELIERLKEKRTALISRTVTRGLPPAAARAAGLPANPPLKPSALDWLDDIPAHWEVKRLRFVARIQTGNTPSKSDDDNYSDEGVLWVKPDDLNAFEPVTNTKEYLSPTGLKLSRPVPAWSALVCCIGTVGKFGFSKNDVATNQQINSVVFESRRVTKEFGLYLIAATESEHISRANKNVVSILNTTQQSNISVPVPPLPEQTAIAAYLDLETAKLDALVGKVEEAVERLQEYRTALITAAVTGKIDVRKEVDP